MGQMQCLAVDNERVECADCDWKGIAADLDLISDFEERVSAGEICPAGQCPDCGALAHLVTDETPDAATLERAAPAMFAALRLALEEFGADFKGPTIDAMRAALDKCSREDTAPETFAQPARVAVATWSHKHGVDVRAFASEAGAEAWRLEIARQWSRDWYSNKTEGKELPTDPTERADSYFHQMNERGDEFFNVEICAVEPDPKAEESTGAEVKAAAARNAA